MIEFFEHPEYKANKEQLEAYRDLFEGKHDVMRAPKYLWPHEFELNNKGGAALRNIREQRTRYVNFLRAIVRRYASMLFKNGIDFSDVEKDLGAEQMADIDGQGTSFENFIRRNIADHYFLYGRPIVLVDAPQNNARNRAEEQILGMRPFMELLHPLEVKDWQQNGLDGAAKSYLQFLRTEYVLLEPRQSADKEPEQRAYSKVYALNGNSVTCTIYRGPKIDNRNAGKSEWVLADEATIAIDELPIAYVFGESWVEPLVPVALLRHNTQSSLDNINLFQAHQRILATGKFREGDGLVMNEGTVTFLPEGSTIEVVEPAKPVSLEQRLSQITAELFQLATFQARILPGDSRQVEGHETLREGKEEFHAALQTAGSELEALVNDALRLYMRFAGKQDYDKKIKFNLDLTVEDVEQQMKLMLGFKQEVDRHPRWRKEMLKKVAAHMDLDKADEIANEIEQKEAPEERRVSPLLQALVNGEQNGARATQGDQQAGFGQNQADREVRS